jgi:hypothetical protein
MKRIVRNDIGFGMLLVLPTLAVVAITGAGAAATQLIALGFLMIGIAWRASTEPLRRLSD